MIQERIIQTIEPINKTEVYLLDHLYPIEYGYYRDVYLCGISTENKDRYIDTIAKKIRSWVERNGGRFVALSNQKWIDHGLHRKGIIVQIVFPSFGKRDMKNVMARLYHKRSDQIRIR